jgi:Transposase IS116/IS110/IS902 family
MELNRHWPTECVEADEAKSSRPTSAMRGRWSKHCRSFGRYARSGAGVGAEIGDFRRFDHPRQLMAYVGLVPGERSSGETRRSTSITKTGSTVARKLIAEAAWA